MTVSFAIEPLAAKHDRRNFSCGTAALDRYFREQAGQDVRRRISNCFVAIPSNGDGIAGFYTLAASSIPLTDLPGNLTKKMPRYPVLPAALIGRLAVDRRFQKMSLGASLLYDAIHRARSADPAVFTLLVDSKDESAAEFYRHFGFVEFANRTLSLFLPMATVIKLR